MGTLRCNDHQYREGPALSLQPRGRHLSLSWGPLERGDLWWQAVGLAPEAKLQPERGNQWAADQSGLCHLAAQFPKGDQRTVLGINRRNKYDYPTILLKKDANLANFLSGKRKTTSKSNFRSSFIETRDLLKVTETISAPLFKKHLASVARKDNPKTPLWVLRYRTCHVPIGRPTPWRPLL